MVRGLFRSLLPALALGLFAVGHQITSFYSIVYVMEKNVADPGATIELPS
jgi:hypothetical protein